jgi:hypothetical protein
MLTEKVIFDDDIEYEIEDKNTEYIAAAYNSMAAMELIDTGLMNAEDKEMVKNIQHQAINIISESLNNIFNEIFDTSADNTDQL